MTFDSDEEEWFSWMLEELRDAGIVTRFDRAKEITILPAVKRHFYKGTGKKGMKTVEKGLVRELCYTPDFCVEWNMAHPDAWCFAQDFHTEPGLCMAEEIPFLFQRDAAGSVSIIEVKPGFDRHGKSQYAIALSKALLRIPPFWYVQMVKVTRDTKGIFAEAFTPAKFLRTPRMGKERKLGYTPRSLADFIALNRARLAGFREATGGLL